jgi:NAD(P)-dependent dehydrogenase (short-subunit alcohol dehydrogenase family)
MPKSPFASYPSLRDRRVLITGGASGIGEAMVEAFAAQGAKVAFLDIDARAGKALAKRIGTSGGHAPRFFSCDLLDLEALKKTTAAAAKAIGPVEVLINNAARDDRHKVEEITPERWEYIIGVNLRHQFFCCQAVLPGMRKAGGGAIVNFGSITYKLGFTGLPVYVTAKGGVVGMTRALARELGPEHIRVNCIIPGWIMTERQQTLWLTPEADAMRASAQALPDRIAPAEVARLALFLASDDSRMCTGQEFTIDAGWSM